MLTIHARNMKRSAYIRSELAASKVDSFVKGIHVNNYINCLSKIQIFLPTDIELNI